MDKFFSEKFAEFLAQNKQQIISNVDLLCLERRVMTKENELKESQEALKKLQINYSEKSKKVNELRKKVTRKRNELTDEYVCKSKYEEVKSTLSEVKKQLEASNETISYERKMRLEVDVELQGVKKKSKLVEERERCLDASKKDLMLSYKELEKKLKDADEFGITQIKLKIKSNAEKEKLSNQFKTEVSKTRAEIVALKNEIDRLTMEQFKLLAFVKEIVNTSGFEGYSSDDAYTVCGQLDGITNHVKSQCEKWKKDLTKLEKRVNQKNNRLENQGRKNRSLSPPPPPDRGPSIGIELRSSEPSTSNQPPQQTKQRSQLQPLISPRNSVKARKPVTKRQKYRKGKRRLQQEILKKKKHAMWVAKRGNGTVQGRWWCECGKVFKRKTALKTHIEYYSLEWKFQCEKCPEIFRFLARLKHHLTKEHGIFNPLKEFEVGCSICGEMFPNRRALGNHRIFFCTSESGNETPHRSRYRRVILTTPLRTPNYDISGTVTISESESDQDENLAGTSKSLAVLHKTNLNHAGRKDEIDSSVLTASDTETDSTSSSDRKTDGDAHDD